MMYCPRCRTKYKNPPDVCRYCEIPLVEELPTRTLTDFLDRTACTDDEEYSIDHSEAGQEETPGPLEEEDQKVRVKLLNRYLLLRLLWFAVWLAAGLSTAYLTIPDDASQEMSLIIFATFAGAALILGSLILKKRARHTGDTSHTFM